MTYVLILGIKMKKMEINFSEATWNLFLYLCKHSSRVSSGSNKKICHSFRYILVRQWKWCVWNQPESLVVWYRTILCAEIQFKIESCSFHNNNEWQWQNTVWYVSKNRLLLQHISFVPLAILVPPGSGLGAPEVLLRGDTTDTTGNKWLDKHFLLVEVLRWLHGAQVTTESA